MSDIFQAFIRKPFEVFAVQATPFNLEELAEECGGTIKHNGQKEGNLSRDYIQLRVEKPLTQRQTELHVGDWLVKQGRKYKSYPEKQFQATFELRNNSASPAEIKQHVKPSRKKKRPNRGPRPAQGVAQQQAPGQFIPPSPAAMPKKKSVEATSPEAAAVRRHQEAAAASAPRVITDARIHSASLVPDTPENRAAGAHPIELVDNGEKIIQETFGETAEMTADRRQRESALVDSKIEEGKLPLSEPDLIKVDGVVHRKVDLTDVPVEPVTPIEEKGVMPDSTIITVNTEEHGPAEMVVKKSEQYDRQKDETHESWKARLQDQQIDPHAFASVADEHEDLSSQVENEPAPKPMTLDELNAMPGDPRSAQEIMLEEEQKRQAGGGQAYPEQTPGEQFRGEA